MESSNFDLKVSKYITSAVIKTKRNRKKGADEWH